MFDNLFEELAAMKDAWRMDAREALRFIAENRDMYDGSVGIQFDKFIDVMEVLVDTVEEGESATIH